MEKHKPKYIEVEGIMRACYDSFLKTGNKAYSEIIALAEAVPAADVQEVKHGRWEKDTDTAFFWKCSECGAYLFWRKEEYLLRDTDEPNYCPNCGASMDKVEE